MNDRAQRVLDALVDYDADNEFEYPIQAITKFFANIKLNFDFDEDYESLTADEEKQVIQAFLDFAY